MKYQQWSDDPSLGRRLIADPAADLGVQNSF